jgi:hypothetical protein
VNALLSEPTSARTGYVCSPSFRGLQAFFWHRHLSTRKNCSDNRDHLNQLGVPTPHEPIIGSQTIRLRSSGLAAAAESLDIEVFLRP